jgi:glutamate---cysteine ligase / carboxylate-amine ligase
MATSPGDGTARLLESGDPTMSQRFTLGIEEEFQLVDPLSRELKSHIEEMLAAGAHLGDQIKPELHQSVVEVGTPVCADIREARAAVFHLRRSLVHMAERSGARIVAAGTHPFSHWKDQEITDRTRYQDIVNEMEDLARANLVFGLHVHVGVADDEMRVQIMNGVRAFLPHLLALSVNSPFWCGRRTGVKSVRSTIFKRFPRTQVPEYFHSWSDYARFVDLLVRTRCVDDGRKIWWDVRPHAYFKTLEFRVCDIPCRAEETVALAALCQALVAKLHRLFEANLGIRQYMRAIIMENKFRALRAGLDGQLIDFGLKGEAPTRSLILEVLDFVEDVVDDLGIRGEMAFLRTWAAAGDTGADRQLRAFGGSGDLRAVVDLLVDETRVGL